MALHTTQGGFPALARELQLIRQEHGSAGFKGAQQRFSLKDAGGQKESSRKAYHRNGDDEVRLAL